MNFKQLIIATSALFLGCSTNAPIQSKDQPLLQPLQFTGVNLNGAEFGSNLPGKEGYDYAFPTFADVDYFASKNLNAFRIGFSWERLQPKANGDFDPAYFAKLDALTKYATSKGITVFLSPHNYARYYSQIIGSPEVPNHVFANLWMRLATHYKSNPLVAISLMNEPHDMDTTKWLSAANAAITAIRGTGNQTLIAVPGNAWTGAGNWFATWVQGGASSTIMNYVVDPANNYVIEIHAYADKDFSGSYANGCSTETFGAELLKRMTEWAKTNKKRILVGELNAIDTPVCQKTIQNMLIHMKNNPDVYAGWLIWSGGSRWGTTYRLNVNKNPDGSDNAKMLWYLPYIPNRNAAAAPDAGAPVDAGNPQMLPSIRITSSTPTSYCAELDVKNASSQTRVWTFVNVNIFDATITNSWQTSMNKRTGIVKFEPLDWNKNVASNTKQTFGWCALYTSGKVLPQVITYEFK